MSTYIILGSSINLFTSIYRYLFLLLPNMIYIIMLPDDCLIWSCPIYPIWSYVISYFPGGWASLDQGTASIADSKEPQRRIDSPSYEKLEARWENMGESTRIKKRTKVHAKRPILSMQISAKLHIPRTFACGSRLICKLKPFPGSIATWLCKTLPISAHPFTCGLQIWIEASQIDTPKTSKHSKYDFNVHWCLLSMGSASRPKSKHSNAIKCLCSRLPTVLLWMPGVCARNLEGN